jgi:hypothetical protein
MTYNNPFSDDYFSQGHKSLTQGTFIFGGVLFLLAILIFVQPALIAYFIAGVILLAGMTVLAIAWKLWRFSKNDHTSRVKLWETPHRGDKASRVIYFRWVA